MTLLSSHSPGSIVGPRLGVLSDTVNDANSTRNVYLLAAGLAVLGIALVIITVWFWRSTHHDPELLAPLEIMGARRFRRLEGGVQREMLDQSRPADAKPMRWRVRRGVASDEPEPEIDLRENARNAPAGYDDLLDPALIAVAVAQSDDQLSGPAPVQAGTSAVLATVPAAGAASSAPTASSADDIDSALAAFGAKVELQSVASSAIAAGESGPRLVPVVVPTPPGTVGEAQHAEPAKPAGDSKSDVDTNAPAGADPGSSAKPVAEAKSIADVASVDNAIRPAEAAATALATAAPPVVSAAPPVVTATSNPRPRGDKPGAKPAAVEPLVIVPVDHELRPARPAQVPRPEDPAARETEVDATVAAVRPTVEEPTSIDPLLRTINRNDG